MKSVSPAPVAYSIKGNKQGLFKIFCIAFFVMWLCAVALMIATLCYSQSWPIIVAFVFITLTVVLPISILIELFAPSCFAFYFFIGSVVFANFGLAFGIGLWLQSTVIGNDVCKANFTTACTPVLGLAWGSHAAQWLLAVLLWVFDWMFVESYVQ